GAFRGERHPAPPGAGGHAARPARAAPRAPVRLTAPRPAVPLPARGARAPSRRADRVTRRRSWLRVCPEGAPRSIGRRPGTDRDAVRRGRAVPRAARALPRHSPGSADLWGWRRSLSALAFFLG